MKQLFIEGMHDGIQRRVEHMPCLRRVGKGGHHLKRFPKTLLNGGKHARMLLHHEHGIREQIITVNRIKEVTPE